LKAANFHSDTPNNNQKCTVQELKGNDKHVNSLGNKNKLPWEYAPVVDPCNITAKENERCSGLKDLELLLTYIMVIWNGDIDKVCMTTTSLTWFEEWIMYAKYIWGRTSTRWANLAASYCVGDYTARRYIEKKK
jgi:hypothetical protein